MVLLLKAAARNGKLSVTQAVMDSRSQLAAEAILKGNTVICRVDNHSHGHSYLQL